MVKASPHFPIFDNTVLAQQPDFATKIGYIVEAWTFIERGLRDILAYTLGCPFEQASALLYSQSSLNGKIAVTKAVANLMPEHQFKAQLLTILEDIRARNKARNKIVHGQYVGHGDRFGYAVILISPERGPSQGDQSPLPNVLDNHARDLTKLMNRMRPFIEHQPDSSERLPVIWRAP